MLNNYPFNDNLVWKAMVDIVNQFLETKAENQGPTILDRAINNVDIEFMKNLRLSDMEFIVKDQEAHFTIKNNQTNESLNFSNRVSTRGEIRGKLLRTELSDRQRSNPNMTLYEALGDIFRGDIISSDLYTYFKTAVFFNPHTQKQIPDSDEVLVNNTVRELVQYKKLHPDATDEGLILHGKNYVSSSNFTSKRLSIFLLTLGVGLAFVLLPGLVQVLSPWIAALGWEMSAGAVILELGLTIAAIGLAIFGIASLKNLKFAASEENSHQVWPDDNSSNADGSNDLIGFEAQVKELNQIGEDPVNLQQAGKLVDSVTNNNTRASNSKAEAKDIQGFTEDVGTNFKP